MKQTFTIGFLTSLIVLLFTTTVNSQSCANYTAIRTTGITYSSMGATGNVVPYWRGQIANQNDDNRSNPVPIGFDFWYLGVRYTSANISINGFIDLSSTTYDGNWPLGDASATPSGYATCGGYISYREDGSTLFNVPCGSGTPPNSFDGTYWALAPMYTDLWASNGTTAVANSIKYKTTGSAPNRVFTVEYFNMDDWASAATSDYNFQVKLYETSGKIEFVYGTMTAAAGSPTPYSCGINGRILTSPPAASELLVQQAVNTGTFGNTVPALFTTAPASNSQISFTPVAPANPGSTLTFSAVGNTSMTLNWTDWATNEQGYVIYVSTDGVNYTFQAQTAANAVSYAASGLYGTTYWWKVYAVTEGCLSSPISGSQATLPAGTFISITTGNWGTGSTWNAGTVPTNGDNVTIANGHVVTIDGSYGCTNLTVGQGTSGTLLIGNSAVARTFTVLGTITVNAGASFTPNTAFAATHSMPVSSNIINNGTINMRPTATSLCNIIFNKNGNQTISGTGATNNYNNIAISMGSNVANTLEVTASNFSAPSNFLTMNNGTFKFSVPASAVTLDVFTTVTTIPATCGLWMNSPNSIMYAHSTLNFQGDLTCSSGTVNVGDNANEALMSNGALLTISGGTVNVSGRLDRPSYVAVTNMIMSGGTLNLNTVGSTSTTNAPFMIDVAGSSFNMSGGTIVIKNEGGTGAQDLGYVNTGCTTNYSVTGGTLQIGNASTSAGQTMSVETNIPVYNFTTETNNSPTSRIITNPLTVLNDITIKSGGTFNANNLNVNVGRHWVNNGTFTPGTQTVTFNGTVGQQISGTSTTTFNSLTISNSSASGLTLASPANMSGLLTLTNGKIFTTTTNILALSSVATATSGSSSSFVSGPMSKDGTANFIFPVGKGTRWRRAGITGLSATATFRAEYFGVGYTNTTAVNAPLNNVSVLEYWQLDRIAGAGNATVSLYWESATASAITDCPDLTIARWNGASWDERPGTTSGGSVCTGAGTGSVVTNSIITAFSPFTFGSKLNTVNPLPVELLNFEAKICNKDVCLNWSTATETNNDFFTIQRTQDGLTFDDVSVVDGAGTSTNINDYNSLDNKPFMGVSYYRLKQTDFNGACSYSQMEMISFENNGDFSFDVYPNPNNGEDFIINVNSVSGDVLVVVYDATGRETYSKIFIIENKGQNVYAIDPSGKLSAGVYFITATSQQSIVSHKMIIK